MLWSARNWTSRDCGVGFRVFSGMLCPIPLWNRPRFVPIRSGRFTFLFVGILTYLPNWDAVLFFCTRVVPILRRVGPGELRVLIVGRVGCDLDLNKLTAIEEVRVVANPLDLSPTTRSPTRLSSRSGAAVEPASKFS